MLLDTIKENENVQVNSKEMEALKEHFPQCFDASGNFDIAIFEELVKTKDISIKKEGYALNFLGKSYARYLSNLESETVIVPDENNKDNPSENIYIVGDNLDALQHLKHSYAGAIKCIYIDPPYNTGSDGFMYNDKFEFSAKDLAEKIGIEEDEAERVLNMQGKSTHSAWLTFMYPRLELAKELLSDDGVIFISIDDNEQANCKLLCDAVFGENNCLGIIANINNPKGRSDDKYIATAHEYLLVYVKNVYIVGWYGFEPTEIIIKRYNKKDAFGKKYREIDLRKTGENDLREDRPNLFYYFYYAIKTGDFYPDKEDYTKDGYIQIKPQREDGKEGNWRWSIDTAKKQISDLLPKFMPSRKIWGVMQKDYLDERALVKPVSAWTFKDVNSERGTEEFVKLKFDKRIFAKPKPIGTIIRCLKLSTNKNDIILDFFSGSATTAHAVMLNNVTDDKKMKYIMVQLNEPVKKGSEAEKAGYKTIDEIGRERIRRAAAKIRADEPEKSKDVDLGFKTYYLKTPEKQTLDKMESFNPEFPIDGDDIIEAFGKDTVLATWEIKDGYGFNTPIKEIDLKGYTAYFINDGIHGANLYLLDEISEPSIMELVRRLEANELVADKIIVYGYALSFTASTSLRTNLKTLKNRNPIDVVIRY